MKNSIPTIINVKPKSKALAEIAASVLDSGKCPDQYLAFKRQYDHHNPSRYIDTIDREKTIALLTLTAAKGKEIGLPPITSIYSIVWYNGKPCLYGDMAFGLCMKHPDFDGMYSEFSPENDSCKVSVGRKKVAYRGEFSLEDAKLAKLDKLSHWKEYPQRMLEIRAKTWAFRSAFPDVLNGVGIAEEMRDFEMVKGNLDRLKAKNTDADGMDKFTEADLQGKDTNTNYSEAMQKRIDTHPIMNDKDYPIQLGFKDSV